MKRILLATMSIMLTVLACGTPSVNPTSTPSDLIPTAPGKSSGLWYLTRGETKSDQFWGIDTDLHGNVYAAGYFQSPASALFFDMVIYKFTPEGSEIWRTQWGGKLEEKAFIVFVDEPYVYVGGTQHTSTALDQADMAILALDMNTGEVLWNFIWGQGFGYEEVDGLVTDGDYLYISGWTTGKTTEGDVAVLKLDRSDGSLIWAKPWGTSKFDEADGQMVVDENFIFVSGRLEGTNALLGGQALIAKFSKDSGDMIAFRTWGGPIFNDGLGMTSDGTYLYVVGLTLGFGNGGQIFLLKYDKKLHLLWQELWGGKGGESARAAAVDDTGNILIAGNTDSYGSGEGDVALLSFNSTGKLNWSSLWGGALKDATQGIALFDGSVYLVGASENNSEIANDALLIKADARTGQFPENIK